MKHSDSQTKIGPALVAALGKLTNPAKSAVNPFFKSMYCPLNATLDAVRPVLAENGLAMLQSTESGADGMPCVVTRLVHASGEWIESEPLRMKPVKDDPQMYGSALTYARRYSLQALLGITGEADDDGNAASHPETKPAGGQARAQSHAPPQSGTQSGPKPAPVGPEWASRVPVCEVCGGAMTRKQTSTTKQWVWTCPKEEQKCPKCGGWLAKASKGVRKCKVTACQGEGQAHSFWFDEKWQLHVQHEAEKEQKADGQGTEQEPAEDVIPF